MQHSPYGQHTEVRASSSYDYELNRYEPRHNPHPINPNEKHNDQNNNNVQTAFAPKPLMVPYQPRRRKHTSVLAWCMAAICTVLWVAVILLGLAVLIVYLVYRPKSPQFDIASASLNAAYIDTGNLLNADITLLVHIVNPNTKVDIYFSYLQVDMYYQSVMIGTQIIGEIYEPRETDALRYVHIITSAVALPLQLAQEWGNGTQAGGGGVTLNLTGRLKTRWLFGRWFRFTKWLDPDCNILLGIPPNGVLLKKKC